jgi:hypothetical protein
MKPNDGRGRSFIIDESVLNSEYKAFVSVFYSKLGTRNSKGLP